MIWGVDDATHEVVGTEFDHRTLKCGNEEVENWLHHQLSGNASFEFVEGECDGRRVVVLSVRPAFSHTVDFENVAYIRVGSYTKPLKSYPAIEAEVWNKITKADYEASTALEDVPLRNVLELLDYAKYFELLGLPLPQTQEETALPGRGLSGGEARRRALLDNEPGSASPRPQPVRFRRP